MENEIEDPLDKQLVDAINQNINLTRSLNSFNDLIVWSKVFMIFVVIVMLLVIVKLFLW